MSLRRRSSKVFGAALAALFALIILGGCGQEAAPAQKAPLVKTQQAGKASLSEESYSGTVKGRYETNLSFQVGGQILSRKVEEGSLVRAGETLMVIDARDAVQKANAGDAQVSQARAQLNLAQSNLARYTELYHQDVVPKATLDQYQTNYDAAFASYQAALAQSAQGHNVLSYTNLTAGADGVISSVTAEEGQVVAAGQTVAVLVQTNELEVEIAVPEDKVAALQAGREATVTFWAIEGAVRGVVREISPAADPASRTYKVRVSLPQPPQDMQLGMTASVAFAPAAGAEDAAGFELPLAAIYQTGDQPQVWVVEDGQVHLKDIKVKQFGKTSVIVEGLSASDLVVTAGVNKLREGEEVRTEAEP